MIKSISSFYLALKLLMVLLMEVQLLHQVQRVCSYTMPSVLYVKTCSFMDWTEWIQVNDHFTLCYLPLQELILNFGMANLESCWEMLTLISWRTIWLPYRQTGGLLLQPLSQLMWRWETQNNYFYFKSNIYLFIENVFGDRCGR